MSDKDDGQQAANVFKRGQRVRQKLGRVTLAIFFSLLGFVICVAFQNCSGYAAETNPLYDQSSVATCIGLTCGTSDSMLRLSINNDSVVSVKNGVVSGVCGRDDSSCVDIAGACDGGGFPDNALTYGIALGTVTVAETTLAGVKCVDGRYVAHIPLPAGYDFANAHTLRLTIYGVQSDGSRVTSSAAGNYSEVGIISYN